MIQSQPISPQAAAVEQAPPPRSLPLRWVHALLGVQPTPPAPPEPETPSAADEHRTLHTGPACRCNSH